MLKATRGRSRPRNRRQDSFDDFKWWYEDTRASLISLRSQGSWLRSIADDSEDTTGVDPDEPPIFGSPEPPVHMLSLV